jgi:hypothetical protein
MGLETAFQFLCQQLGLLKEAVDELQLNLSGDYYPESQSPNKTDGDSRREQAPLPVQQLADKVSELEGAVEEARHAASSAERAGRHPRNLEEAQLALIVIQRCLNKILKTFFFEVTAYDTIQILVRMGRRQGGKWPQWISLLKTVIEGCSVPLYGSVHAASLCWEELTEKLSAKAISLQATNIGQQITTCQNPKKVGHEFTEGQPR